MARISSIESFRVVAIFGVILWHTDLILRLRQLGAGRWPVDVTLDLIWWASLPYFFLAAGYYYSKSVQTDGHPILRLKHYSFSLCVVLLAWLCIYSVIPENWPVHVRDQGWWQPFHSEAVKNMRLLSAQHLRVFIEPRGTFVWHLWFLPALMFSLASVALIAVFRLRMYVIPFIVAIYVLAVTEEVAGGHLPTLTISVGLWSRALVFTVLGSWLAGHGQPSPRMAIRFIVVGYAIAFIEGVVMCEFFHITDTYRHHYLGGIVLAVGIFLLALSNPNWGQSTPLPFLAKFTLGVYLCHIFVIYTLTAIRWRLENLFPSLLPFLVFLFPFSVYCCAVLLTVILSKVPIARYLVARTQYPTGSWTSVPVGSSDEPAVIRSRL